MANARFYKKSMYFVSLERLTYAVRKNDDVNSHLSLSKESSSFQMNCSIIKKFFSQLQFQLLWVKYIYFLVLKCQTLFIISIFFIIQFSSLLTLCIFYLNFIFFPIYLFFSIFCFFINISTLWKWKFLRLSNHLLFSL